MPTIRCTSCNAINDTDVSGAECENCGQKLPTPTAIGTDASSRPTNVSRDRDRNWDYGEYPDVSLRPQRSEEQKQAGLQVAIVLFIIALINLICGSIAVFALPEALGQGPLPPEAIIITLVIMVGIAAVYAGLGIWALFMPVVAGVVGLIIYIGLALLDIAMSPETALRGVVMKVIIVYVLIRAIAAARKAQ